MKQIKRKKRITYKQFCSIFTKREFNLISKVFKNIYFIEDVDGNYRIEERTNLLFKLTAILALPFVISLSLILLGMLGTITLVRENVDLFSNKPVRVDDCYHKVVSTNDLLLLTGWSLLDASDKLNEYIDNVSTRLNNESDKRSDVIDSVEEESI